MHAIGGVVVIVFYVGSIISVFCYFELAGLMSVNWVSAVFGVYCYCVIFFLGSTLCKDLRLYLSKCFTPGSMDSQLQQVIRENLYLRAVPCEWDVYTLIVYLTYRQICTYSSSVRSNLAECRRVYFQCFQFGHSF